MDSLPDTPLGDNSGINADVDGVFGVYPEPPPAPPSALSWEVWPSLLAGAVTPPEGCAAETWEALRHEWAARDAFGRAKYRRPLYTHNGRDPRLDLIQELYDALAYAYASLVEAPPDSPEAETWASIVQELVKWNVTTYKILRSSPLIPLSR